MYKEVLRDIEGIAAYPAIGLVIFFVFFVAMLVWVWNLSSDYVAQMERLPLDADDEQMKDSSEGVRPHGGA